MVFSSQMDQLASKFDSKMCLSNRECNGRGRHVDVLAHCMIPVRHVRIKPRALSRLQLTCNRARYLNFYMSSPNLKSDVHKRNRGPTLDVGAYITFGPTHHALTSRFSTLSNPFWKDPSRKRSL